MTCAHPSGDHVNGYWVCAQCFQKLEARPVTYVMRRVPCIARIAGADTRWRVPTTRQEPVYAPVAECEGVTLSQFIDIMARRFIARTRGGFHISDARDYAVECLRSLGEPFGSTDIAWDQGGAWDLVDEEMSYWDADETVSN